MALLHKKKTDVPEDAVKLTETQALVYFGKIIEGWENRSDVFVSRFSLTFRHL